MNGESQPPFFSSCFVRVAEPKSGTGTSGEWAVGGLRGTCAYLQSLYGEASCRIVMDPDERFHQEIVFEPGSMPVDPNAICSCSDVTR